MSLPVIILDAPNLLVTLANSPRGYVPIGENGFTVGFVQMIYDGCDKTSVGDYVYFDITKVAGIMYGSTIYYIVPENQKSFKEPLVP